MFSHANRAAVTRRNSGFLARIGAMLGLMRQRRDLAALDDVLLKDLGLTREQAQAEAGRPAWDVPGHWRA